MIQLYAKTSDLVQTELTGSDFDYWVNEYDKGIKDALKILPNGLINQGNTRLEWAILRQEDYMPIDLGYFIGLAECRWGFLMRPAILDESYRIKDFHVNRPIKPANTTTHHLPDFWDPEIKLYNIPLDNTYIGMTPEWPVGHLLKIIEQKSKKGED